MISVFGSKVGAEEMEEVRSSLENQWMGIGPKTKKFEEAFAAHLGVSHFALLDSGSNALLMAVKLLNLPAGSQVIVPSFTWISCAHAIVLSGCVPVFCDVELDTQNVSIDTVRPHLTDKTRAIMVVHYAGLPVDMDPILGLGLPVIEDAAHAVDSRLGDRACGTLGDIGVFSFDAVKNLAMGEGGGIAARPSELVERARLLRYCGIGKSGFEASVSQQRWWEYHITDFFPKLLPNDVMASVGLAQLRKLAPLQASRRRMWQHYQDALAGIQWLIRPQDPRPQVQHSYFTYLVRVLGGRRDDLARYLYSNGIYTTLRYHPLHLNLIYGSTAKLPNCEQLNEEGLNLPLHPNLSEEDVEKIIRTVKNFR